MKNIHDTVIMASWQPMSKPTTWYFVKLMYMMYWFMSRCHNKDISNNVIFAFKMSLLSEGHLMTLNVMSWLWRCHVSLM